MKKLKSHFKFNKQERSGIFFLLLIIALFQIVYFLFKVDNVMEADSNFKVDGETQVLINQLKEKQSEKDTLSMYPFNPNFITDFRGYTLGMSPGEIDRLHAFRSEDKFVNSPEEFQQVTLVSDSLLRTISPYFKFPDWTVNLSRQSQDDTKQYQNIKSVSSIKGSIPVKDINKATASELKTINGIGDVLSARIIKFRDRLGGFLVDGQLYDVYGLDPIVAERALKKFRVTEKPVVEKININSASASELSRLVYINYNLAERVIAYRENIGSFGSLDELTKIQGFPEDKIDRIKLYLTL